jgi:hypothetical protein
MPLRRTAPLAARLQASFGLAAVLGLWVWLDGVRVWPHLFRSAGDFGYQYTAAAALLAGASPYSSPWYDYPPLPPLALVPFALLPLDAARIAWFFAGHACLLGAALLLVRPLGGHRAAAATVAGVWLLAGTVQENLALGQWNPVLLLLVVLALRWDGSRPARSAAVLGLAAALKIWPGLLLAADLSRRRGRALAAGLAAAAAGVVLPVLALALLTGPPYRPTHGTYWMGSPHPLNFSLPAAVLRASYGPADPVLHGVPLDWELGNNTSELRLAPGRRALSVAVSLAVLAGGLGVLALRALTPVPSPISPPSPGRGAPPPICNPRDGALLLAALVALALVAAPLAWYHYQLLQLPGFALLAAPRLRSRAVLPLLGLAALLAGLTRTQFYASLARALGAGELAALQTSGWIVPLLGLLLFGLLVRELGRPESG